MADLTSLLAGLDPTMALQLQGGLAASIGADPSRIPTANDPFQTAAANIAGNFERSRAADLADRISQMRQGAVPDLLQALAAPDPQTYAAQNAATMNPIAAARLASTTPAQVAEMRNQLADAALRRAQTILPTARGGLITSGTAGIPTRPEAMGPGSGLPAPRPSGNDPTAGIPPIQGAEPPDPAAALPPPGAPRFSYLNGLSNRMKRQLIARAQPLQSAPAQ